MKQVAVMLFLTSLGLTSCAQKDDISPCPAFIAYGPESTLDYPIAFSTGVPDNVGTLILSAAAPQKIELLPDVTGATPIATVATSLPSPMPSPISTPAPGSSYFAITVPALASGTIYGVQGLTSYHNGCGGSGTTYAGNSGFTTQ